MSECRWLKLHNVGYRRARSVSLGLFGILSLRPAPRTVPEKLNVPHGEARRRSWVRSGQAEFVAIAASSLSSFLPLLRAPRRTEDSRADARAADGERLALAGPPSTAVGRVACLLLATALETMPRLYGSSRSTSTAWYSLKSRRTEDLGRDNYLHLEMQLLNSTPDSE